MNVLRFQRKTRRWIGLFLLGLTLPLWGLILPSPSALQAWLQPDRPNCNYPVCVLQYGYHSKLLVPVQVAGFDWRDRVVPPAVFQDPNHPPAYVSFGRGSKDWYMRPPQSAGEQLQRMWSTLLLPNSPILRVQWHDQLPIDRKVKCVGVNASEYGQLTAYLQAGLQLDAAGQNIFVTEDVGDRSQFYATPGRYSLVNNSNHWTAGGLKAAHLPTPLWPAHAAPVMFYFGEDRCPELRAAGSEA